MYGTGVQVRTDEGVQTVMAATTIKSVKEDIRKLLLDLDSQGIHVTHVDVSWQANVTLGEDSIKPTGVVAPIISLEAKL